MHLGLILPSFSTGASMQIPSISLLARSLAGEIDVTVFPLRNPPGTLQTSVNGMNVCDLCGAPMRFRTLTRQAIKLIRERHRSYPLDLLHAYWLFEPGAIAAAAGRLLGLPVVTSIGGAELVSIPSISYGGLGTKRGRLLNTGVLKSADLVTGGSRYVLDLASSLTPSMRPKLRLAPLPVEHLDVNPNGAPSGSPAGSQRLLQVGAFLPVKGQDISIRALAELSREHPDAELTIIGEDPHGYRTRMRALGEQLGLADRLRLLDRIPHDELGGYYRGSDILLMPSRHESQGMVVLEAAARGLPTVGSDVGVVRDLAPDAAVAVPVNDPGALASTVSAILRDDRQRAQLGDAARNAVRDRYSVGPVVQTWLDLYREVAGGS